MSTLACPVVRIDKIERNPNADTLDVWPGPQGPCQFKRGDYVVGDLAVFIPADTMLPVSRPEFAMFAGKAKTDGDDAGMFRLRGVKLRGMFSVGLLVKAPQNSTEGMDAAESLGCRKYEPPTWLAQSRAASGARLAPAPSFHVPVYDIENTWKLPPDDGEFRAFVVTEKIHGSNWRAYRDADGLHIGSRTQWLRWELGDNPSEFWCHVARRLADNLARLPEGVVLFGEVYGPVQDLKYGAKTAQLAIFDAWDVRAQQWQSWNALEALSLILEIPTVPVFAKISGQWTGAIEWARARVSGMSALDAGTIREGFVVRPSREANLQRTTAATDGGVLTEFVRLIAKVVSPEYLSRKGGSEAQE